MNELNLTYHSPDKIRKLRDNGVCIPDLSSVCIGHEIQLEQIRPDCVIHPFSRITGAETQIHEGAQIGLSGAATLHNSCIGENVIVGNLGPVTLKNTVVGPGAVLGCGVAEEAVILGKESKINDFTAGYGFRIRKGSLYEEDASSAQHTDTKMTVLFPWTTLGSNINFCDALLAGGSGAELGMFSEVGSGTIHFNYSIRGDKATASLLGDVSSGVFLDQERLFIGGNNSLLGPLKADFGTMTAAGARINGTLSAGLHFGHSMPKGRVDYDQRIFSKQLDVLAELTTLFHWYQQIRINCVAQTPEQKFIYQAGLRTVELNFHERLFQLNRYVEALEDSLRLSSGSKQLNKKEIADQKQILAQWPELLNQLQSPTSFEVNAPEALTKSIAQQVAENNTEYTQIIKELDPEAKQKGKVWLNSISGSVRQIFYTEFNKE